MNSSEITSVEMARSPSVQFFRCKPKTIKY